MNEESTRGRQLGRGLSALFGEETEDLAELDSVRQSKMVPIGYLRAGRFQPRRDFDDAADCHRDQRQHHQQGRVPFNLAMMLQQLLGCRGLAVLTHRLPHHSVFRVPAWPMRPRQLW